MSTIDAAARYIEMGYQPVPIAPRDKRPVDDGWQRRTFVPADFAPDGNIGLKLGDPSGGLVDVDCDCPEAVELAPLYLPPTPVVTGRDGRPRSHFWYICPGSHTRQFRDPQTRKMIVELRSTGGQTLVGPSQHPEGGRYDDLQGTPATAPFDVLLASVQELHRACLVKRYGAAKARELLEPKKPPAPPQANLPDSWTAVPMEQRERRAVAYINKYPPAISGQGGHPATYALAVAIVHGFAIDEERALELLLRHYNPRCQPQWAEHELRHKVHDAATKPHDKPYGYLLMESTDRQNRRQHGRHIDNVPHDDAPQAADDHRPEIELTAREFEVVGQVIKALAASKAPIFQRAGQLVTITTEATNDKRLNRPAASPIITALPQARLRTFITEAVRLVKVKADGTTAEANPPQWLVLGVDAAGEWPGIRPLTGITEVPILRPDGTVLQTPGYDPATGILFCPYGPTDPVPDHPDKADAEAARDLLLDLVCDFPFAGEIDKAGWLALVLTVLARQAFDGPAPLFLIDANTRGSGKGKLADVAGKITTGRGFARTTATRDDDEMRKAITTLALQGERTVLFDNVAGTLGNASLDAALTADEWQCRILGSNHAPRLPLAVTWLATGNNVALAADTARRVCRIRLESPLEKPEERADFRHTDLLGYVQRNRARLAAAALTILRAWFVAGQPKQPLTPWGSFEAWSDLVRQAVVWVGLPDPGDGRQELQAEADLEGNLLRLLIAGIENADPERQGLKSVDMIRLAEEHPDDHPALKAAIDEITPLGKTPSPKSIGRKLRELRKRVVGGKCIDCARDASNTTLWGVKKAHGAGSTGSSGSVSPSPTREKDQLGTQKYIAVGLNTSGKSGTSGEACNDHEPHEITTSDGWLRTECRHCGAVLEKDRPPDRQGASC